MRSDPVDDDKPAADKLPGNHGQFGNDNATEEYEPLQPATPGPQPTDPGERA